MSTAGPGRPLEEGRSWKGGLRHEALLSQSTSLGLSGVNSADGRSHEPAGADRGSFGVGVSSDHQESHRMPGSSGGGRVKRPRRPPAECLRAAPGIARPARPKTSTRAKRKERTGQTARWSLQWGYQSSTMSPQMSGTILVCVRVSRKQRMYKHADDLVRVPRTIGVRTQTCQWLHKAEPDCLTCVRRRLDRQPSESDGALHQQS